MITVSAGDLKNHIGEFLVLYNNGEKTVVKLLGVDEEEKQITWIDPDGDEEDPWISYYDPAGTDIRIFNDEERMLAALHS